MDEAIKKKQLYKQCRRLNAIRSFRKTPMFKNTLKSLWDKFLLWEQYLPLLHRRFKMLFKT